MQKVIVNSTPMIILSKIGQIDVLHTLFGEIIIPQAVYDEITYKSDDACRVVKETDWIKVANISDTADRSMYKSKLHDGEVEVMILAQEENGDVLVIIDDNTANVVIAQMLFLESQNPDKDINLYINSPGGSISAGMAIYDTMRYIKPDLVTICVGMAASMASILLMAGAKGKRFALPNARIMIHQPWGGAEGKASDIEITAREILRLKERLNHILADHSGKSYEDVVKDTDRDYFMSADEAAAYGLIDSVVKPKK